MQDWTTAATTDEATIRRWFQQWPDANVGVATGAESGIVVLDVDPRDFGDESLAELEREHGRLPNTVEAKTGSGGRHILFRHPGTEVKNRVALITGLDIRGDGGQIVVAPSSNRHGAYAWEVSSRPGEVPIAEIPNWLLTLVNGTDAPNGKEQAPEIAGHILKSTRNATLTSFAGTMRRRGASQSEIEAALKVMNAERCKPPLDGKEVRSIAASVARYEPGAPLAGTNEAAPPSGASGESHSAPVVPGTVLATFDLELCPPLPPGALPDPKPAEGAATFLDFYVPYATSISPMTPMLFHESAALGLASAVIARRVVLRTRFGAIFPNIFVLWLATTTIWRKTTALEVARSILRRLFPHLLACQDTTPEAFFSDMAGREPVRLDDLPEAEQARWRNERDFAAQRFLVLDEMSGLMAGAGRDYNAGLLEAFLRFYDCDESYTRSTRAQGRVIIRNACLGMLAASTPAAMAEHLKVERLWSNGWWPRFGLLTPDKEYPDWQEPWDATEPAGICEYLTRLYKRLPAAKWPDLPTPISAQIESGVLEMVNHYNKAVSFDLLRTDAVDRRLFGTYGRLPTQALKIATILGALDWDDGLAAPVIQQRHMAKALLIAERWRASAHRALAASSKLSTEAEFSALARRIVAAVTSKMPKGATLRDICRLLGSMHSSAVRPVVEELVMAGQLEEVDVKPERGRPTACYRIAPE